MSDTSFWIEVILGIAIGVVGVVEPILLIFARKIKILAAKRLGKYDCWIVYPSKLIEDVILPMCAGTISYTKGDMSYLWTINPDAMMQTQKEGMPTLILFVGDENAINTNEILNALDEKTAKELRPKFEALIKEMGYEARIPVSAFSPLRRPLTPTAHAQKAVVSGFDMLSRLGLEKKDFVTILLVIVLLLSIGAIVLGAMALNNTGVLTSPGFSHLIAQANPTS